ncbi:unnamed protein product [Miscanthus lutarioriparius]|uniref:Uncharacterized protein n=1 Tax=Miscanthus lutarioriparius TaxID=422564 RepID=A0A811QBF3_9POAL|nr:unnamed protein product [Miscanthus lutarioriparius]
MLPGVELARRRRVHYHGDVASSSAEHHYYAHGHHAAPAPTGVAGPTLAARIRLEEKLRGAALPPTSPSRWSRLRATPRHPPSTRRRDEQQDVVPATGAEPGPESWRPPAPDPAALLQAAAADMPASTRRQRRAELTRTLSKVDVREVEELFGRGAALWSGVSDPIDLDGDEGGGGEKTVRTPIYAPGPVSRPSTYDVWQDFRKLFKMGPKGKKIVWRYAASIAKNKIR